MFVIQYEAVDGTHKMQTIQGNSRNKLITHLSRFQRPIVAVYERNCVITKAMQKALRDIKGQKISAFASKFAKPPATDTETFHQT